MNDFMYEQLVARRAKPTDYLISALMIVLIIVLVIFGLPLLGFFAILLAIAAAFIAFSFVFPRLKVEYEYILLNHDMQVDIIYNKSRRKTLLEFDICKVESINAGTAAGPHGSEKTYDFTSGTDPQAVYAIKTALDNQNVCILFEPDETMKVSMNKWLGPHMQLR